MVNFLGFNFHIYGLLIGIGIWAAYEVSVWFGNKIKIEERIINEGLWWVLIPGIIGARLYHVIDLWEVYQNDLIQIVKVWEGGLGIFGAVLGGILGVWLYGRYKQIEVEKMFDVTVIGAPLAQAIGRWGNYFNNELWGRNGEPLFLYESILNMILFLYLRWVVKNEKYQSLSILGRYLIGYGLIRFGLEPMRAEEVVWTIGSVPMAQLISLLFVAIGIWLLKRKTRMT